jgi:hypothetical protein
VVVVRAKSHNTGRRAGIPASSGRVRLGFWSGWAAAKHLRRGGP